LVRSRWAPGAETLADAARAVAGVIKGRSGDDALAPFDESGDRAAVRAIALGTMRWYLRLLPAVNSLLKTTRGITPEVHALLIAGAHQIEYSRNAPQATVHVAVDAARVLGQERAAGLVNAVLRRFVAERAALLADADRDVAARTAHPPWLVEQLKRAWPGAWESILEGNNTHPPMVLRIDRSRRSVEDYLKDLSEAGLVGEALPWAPSAVRLERPVAVGALPGFDAGYVSVQDAGAQLAAPFLDAQEGMRVLDACAAPGGKTGHILEYTPGLAELVAVDIDAERVARIGENLSRLHRQATLMAADIRDPEVFRGHEGFDRILVDVPCSSLGVIRRHPDIKLLRRNEDGASLSGTQFEILNACFALLRPGGRLLYSTCSVLPDENERVVTRFFRGNPRATPVKLPLEVPGLIPRVAGMQLLPGGDAATDGFYYACLEKTTTGT